jgi:hypothetical protein
MLRILKFVYPKTTPFNGPPLSSAINLLSRILISRQADWVMLVFLNNKKHSISADEGKFLKYEILAFGTNYLKSIRYLRLGEYGKCQFY